MTVTSAGVHAFYRTAMCYRAFHDMEELSMTRLLMALTAAALFLSNSAIAQSARAPGGFYLGGSVGAAVFWDSEAEIETSLGEVEADVEYDALGFAIAGQVGYFVNDNIRLEAELAYQSAEGEIDFGRGLDVDLSVIRGTISAYYDFDSTSLAGFSSLRPYVGGGIGFVNLDPESDDLRGEDDSTELTFQGEIGTSYDFSPHVAVVPAVRLEYTGETDFESTIASVFKVGIRFVP